jgi:hypothetical protein
VRVPPTAKRALRAVTSAAVEARLIVVLVSIGRRPPSILGFEKVVWTAGREKL